MKPQGGSGNPYAAQLVMRRRKGALRSGKSVGALSHCFRRRPNRVAVRPLPLLDESANFGKSAIPERVMFFCDENWRDFPSEAMEAIERAFGAAEACVVVEIDGTSSLLDFLRMVQLDLTDGNRRSIAWIDVEGKCFFPKRIVGREKDGCDSCNPIKLKIELKIDGASKVSGKTEGQAEGRGCRGGQGVEDGLIGGNEANFRGGENGAEGDQIGSQEREQPKLLKGQEIVAHLPDLNQDMPVEGKSGEPEEKRIMEPRCLRENCTVIGNSANRLQDKEPQNFENTNEGGQCSLRKRNLDCFLNPNEKQDSDDMPDAKRVHLTSSESIKSVCIVAHAQRKPVFDLKVLKLVKLMEINKSYMTVKNLFLGGIGKISSKTRVDSIYWCSHGSPMGSARLQVFQKNIQMTKSARGGEANIRYGWYGASSKVIENIIQHGFGQFETRTGAEAYGTGIYLSAEDHSQASASHLGPDDDGMFHVMLCRVIMGNMEQIKLGSCQFQPSNEGFDSGVDNLGKPRLYVVWSTHMNTHILPEYILSFRVSEQSEESWRRRQLIQDSNAIPVSRGASPESCQPRPKSPSQVLPALHPHPSICAREQYKVKLSNLAALQNVSFPVLFSEMRRSLPQSSIESLENLYNDYKAGNVERDILIRTIRAIAGDKLVIAAAHSICNQAGRSNNVEK